jgi:hypothetical protein
MSTNHSNDGKPPEWIQLPYEQIKQEFPDCVVRYCTKDFNRHHSIKILNPACNREFSVQFQTGDSGLLSLFALEDARRYLYPEGVYQ